MTYTRQTIRDSVERAGDDHWRALVAHHEEAYPASPPTPGEVCRQEAERLTGLGIGSTPDLELVETRVMRTGSEVELVHVLRHLPTGARLWTEPYRNYAAAAASSDAN